MCRAAAPTLLRLDRDIAPMKVHEVGYTGHREPHRSNDF
jgi:hypothetical protein